MNLITMYVLHVYITMYEFITMYKHIAQFHSNRNK